MVVRSNKVLMMAALGIAMILAGSGTAQAVSVTVGNTTMSFDDTKGTVTGWKVNTMQHLKEISFWYSVDGGTPEQIFGNTSASNTWSGWSIATNSAQTKALAKTDGSTGTGLDFALSYTIASAASGSPVSDVAPKLVVDNMTGREINLRIEQIVNLDLGGQDAGDVVSVPSSTSTNAMLQKDGPVQVETGLVPPADGWAIDSGDVAWTLVWDRTTFASGTSVIIESDMLMSAQVTPQAPAIPEPLTMVSVALCLAGVGRYVRRRGKAAHNC